jgi:DnaJ-class molecular chaperone
VSTEQDYYETLGIPHKSEPREVKRAYRSLARELHPDLPGNKDDEDVAERFKLVREAYEVLSDPVRKKEYDIWGRDPFGASDLPWAETEHARYSSREKTGDDIELTTETGEGLDGIFADLFEKTEASSPPPTPGKESPWKPAEMEKMARLDIAGEVKARKEAEAAYKRKTDQARAARGDSDGGMGDGGGTTSQSRWGFDAEAMAQAAFWGELDDLEPAPEAGPMPDHDPWDAPQGAPGTEQGPGLDLGSAGAFGGAGGPTTGKTKIPPRERRARPRSGKTRTEPEVEPVTAPEPAPKTEDLRITVQVPFMLALNGGVHSTRFRLPDDAGRWAMEELDLNVPPGLEDGGQIRLRGRGQFGTRQGHRGDLVVDVIVEEHPVFRRDGPDVVVQLPLTPAEAAAGCRVEVPTINGSAHARVPPGVRSGQRIMLRGMGLLDPKTGRRGNQHLVAQIQLPPNMGRDELGLLFELDKRCGWDPRAAWWDQD